MINEQSHRGVQSTYEIKSIVYRCGHEYSESQGKYFGMIESEHGHSLRSGGHDDANPNQAKLLAASTNECAVLKDTCRLLASYVLDVD